MPASRAVNRESEQRLFQELLKPINAVLVKEAKQLGVAEINHGDGILGFVERDAYIPGRRATMTKEPRCFGYRHLSSGLALSGRPKS